MKTYVLSDIAVKLVFQHRNIARELWFVEVRFSVVRDHRKAADIIEWVTHTKPDVRNGPELPADLLNLLGAFAAHRVKRLYELIFLIKCLFKLLPF